MGVGKFGSRAEVDRVVAPIPLAARHAGDGIVHVVPVDQFVRVREINITDTDMSPGG